MSLTTKKIAWISLIPHLGVLAAFIGLFYMAGLQDYVLWGSAGYFLTSIFLRRIVPQYHNSGIRHTKNGDYRTALNSFKESLDFFTKNQWVDDYRYLTILSSSGMSYREMAMVNIAFCYSQLGKGKSARDYYEKALEHFPDNKMAKAAIAMMDADETK